MYRQMLVPIDGSSLVSNTVEEAVAYARATGARVIFFHARPDYAATGEGALMRVVAPEAFEEAAAGNAQAILAKAEAAARAAGVDSASVVVSDRPHEAILATATARGCDLIFMASRGRWGVARKLHGSVTQKVLQETTLPVLVTAVASNLPTGDEQHALSIIRDEHRSLAAVIHGLQHVLNESIRFDSTPDFALLRSMLLYIEAFPERLHHPKEDAYLFARLRARNNECDALIGELERQHAEGAADFAELRHALAVWEAGAAGAAERFAAAVERFAQGQWRHMGAEEALVLPAASRYLTPDDWRAIARAFGDNGDPRFDADTEASFERLFSRLMNLAATQPLA